MSCPEFPCWTNILRHFRNPTGEGCLIVFIREVLGLVDSLMEVGKVLGQLVAYTGFLVCLGRLLIFIFPKQVGFSLLFVAAMLIPVEEHNNALQVHNFGFNSLL